MHTTGVIHFNIRGHLSNNLCVHMLCKKSADISAPFFFFLAFQAGTERCSQNPQHCTTEYVPLADYIHLQKPHWSVENWSGILFLSNTKLNIAMSPHLMKYRDMKDFLTNDLKARTETPLAKVVVTEAKQAVSEGKPVSRNALLQPTTLLPLS